MPVSGDLDTLEYVKQSDANQFTALTDWKYTGSRDDFTWKNVKASGSGAMVLDKVANSEGNLFESAK